MKFVDEIVDGAVKSSVPLSELLRMCRVVAEQFGNDALKQWAMSELNGYPDRASVPAYRILPVQARGMFIGYAAAINDQPLSPSVLKPAHREWATTAYLFQPIAVYEELVRRGEDIGSSWPADLVAHYQDKFMEGYTLNRARQVIPIPSLNGMLETVRNRLLDFALELQSNFVKQVDEGAAVSPDKIDSAFTTIILGGRNVIAGAISGGLQQIGTQTVISGNFASLTAVLNELGVPESETRALQNAVAEDEADSGKKEMGPRVRAWLQKALGYVGTGAAKITGNVATTVLTQALLSYFNIK